MTWRIFETAEDNWLWIASIAILGVTIIAFLFSGLSWNVAFVIFSAVLGAPFGSNLQGWFQTNITKPNPMALSWGYPCWGVICASIAAYIVL